jgi:hypothetical protein
MCQFQIASLRGPQSPRKSSSADAPLWKVRESKQCNLASYFAAPERMQGVRGGEHLPAPAPQEHMQGVRGGEHLPAPAPKEQMQGVRGGGHVPAKKKTQEQRESMCTKSSKELPHKSVTQVSRGELQDIKRAKVAQLRAILRTSRHAHKRQSPGAPQTHVHDDPNAALGNARRGANTAQFCYLPSPHRRASGTRGGPSIYRLYIYPKSSS